MIRFFLWLIGVVLLCVLLVFVLLPTWISTPSGTQTVVRWVNKSIPGHLTIEQLEINWFGTQKVQNLSFKDEKGKELLSFEALNTETALVYLLFGGRSFGETTIINPYLLLQQQEKGKTNLDQALGKKPPKEKKAKKKKARKLPSFKHGLTIERGEVILDSPKISPITISEIAVESLPESNTHKVHARTQQGEIAGEMFFTATFDETMNVVGNVSNFPVAILDELEETTLYTDGLGSTLNATFDLRKGAQSAFVKAQIESANLKASLEGRAINDRLVLSPESHLTFTVTPTFFKSWAASKDWDLVSNTAISVAIEKGVFPLKFKKPTFQDIVLQANATIDRMEINHKDLGSYSLNGFHIAMIALDNIEIAYKGEIIGKETTQIDGGFSITPDWNILYHYDYKGFPVSLLELISPTAATNIRLLFGHTFDFSGEGTYKKQALDGLFTLTSQDTALKGKLKGDLNKLHFDVEGTRSLTGDFGKLLGSSLDLSLNGLLDLSKDSFAIPTLSGSVSNPFLDLTIDGAIGKAGEPFSYDQLKLSAYGTLKALPIEDGEYFKDGKLSIELDGSKNQMVGTIKAQDVNGEFTIHNIIQEKEFSLGDAIITFAIDAKAFPLDFFTSFQPEGIDVAALFGERATIRAKGSYNPAKDPRGELELVATGEGFDASVSMAIDGTVIIDPDKPASIHWELTPERYQALISALHPQRESEPTFRLTRTVPVDLSISQLTCPTEFPKDVSAFFCQTGFVGELNVGTMVFRSQITGESVVIQKITGSIEGENFSRAIDLDLHGDILAANVPQNERSAFAFRGKMLNFWTPDGKFNREGLTVEGELKLDLLPVRQLTGILPMGEKLRTTVQAVLGELVNARIYGEISQMAGPLTIDVKSSNFKAILPLQLTPDALYLRDYVDAEISLTEAVNRALLVDINPLLITGAYADHPIKVYIDPQDFRINLHPLTLRGVTINKAIIDIGKIWVRNGGQIQALMEFLNVKNIGPDGTMEAWFTPIFMSLKDGIADYKRFDLLLAKVVHIALWGDIDLNKDKVKMMLGIAPTTLRQRFNLYGLSKGDLFQVKMRGSTKNLELDWSSAYTRMGILIARTAGGHIGYIVGGLIEQFVQLGEKPAPPPTTDPFPWESQYPSEPGQQIPQEATPSKKKKFFKKLKSFILP